MPAITVAVNVACNCIINMTVSHSLLDPTSVCELHIQNVMAPKSLFRTLREK
jgi:hypothetical protein